MTPMTTPQEIAKQLRQAYLGGNWSERSVKDVLEDVSAVEANKQVYGLNTIAMLTHHMHYFVVGIRPLLEGGALTIRDKFSWETPDLSSPFDWQKYREQMPIDMERLAQLIQQMDTPNLQAPFDQEKYGNYFQNLEGIIEHIYYHLGQIVVLKKILRSSIG